MELNASDERGIKIVRETVKTFARVRAIGEIPFKILILDEADNMTSDAQQALRRTMERFTETCRFILIANYSGKIIEPIQSRCAPFRFTYLPRKEHDEYLTRIVKAESVKIGKDGSDAIFEVCAGDLRRAVNSLQAAASLGKPITADTVYSVVGRASPADVQEMVKLAMGGDFIKAREKLRDMILKYGVAGSDIIKQVHSEIFRLDIPEAWKVRLVDAVGEVDFRLVEGADEEVQLSALLARLVEAGSEIKG
jgi:replication factor C small subunit